MYYPNLKEFIKLSKKGNLIPVYRELVADMETPVSCFAKIQDAKHSFLLESVEGAENIARYSFLGSDPELIFSSKGRNIEIKKPGKTVKFKTQNDPLSEIKKIMSQYKFVPVKGLPRFCGGLVGYIGYDMVRFFEDLPDKNPDKLNAPDSVFVLTDTIIIFDHIEHKIKVVSNAHVENKNSAQAAYKKAIAKIDKIMASLQKPAKLPAKKPGARKNIVVRSNFTKEQFKKAVLKTKEYIRKGDIIQGVISQRFQADFKQEPFDIYRKLRSLNPSPYMYFLNFGDIILIGSSPELLVRCEDGMVETRPIAGTRPRGAHETEDQKLEQELLADPKERAEHVMLVDLGRNDLGRVCDFGSVKVVDNMIVERYSHVMHIVSGVVGKLKKGMDSFDVIRAAFPAGTVTGAPKIRAMEIIDEVENLRRGPYAGCVGYFSFSGNMDTCITIRTIVAKNKTAYVQAGAGIVADSVPEKEYVETQNKAKALVKAIELAETGAE